MSNQQKTVEETLACGNAAKQLQNSNQPQTCPKAQASNRLKYKEPNSIARGPCGNNLWRLRID